MTEIDPKRPDPERPDPNRADPNRADPNRTNLDQKYPQRNRYGRWWLWVIILIIIIFLIWWWAGGWNNGGVSRNAVGPAPVAGVDQGTRTATEPGAGAPIAGAAGGAQTTAPVTSLVGVSASQLPGMVGRRVDLTRVQVQSVVGDTGFYVGSSAQDRIFVQSSHPQGANTTVGTEQPKVTAGSLVDVRGTIESASSMQPQRATGQGMAAGLPSGTQAFVAANQVHVVQ